MSMYALRESFRDLLDRIEFEQPVFTVPVQRPAANADRFRNPCQQARLRRRARRMDGVSNGDSAGWSLRTW